MNGGLASNEGDRGPNSVLSCIVATIFSSVTGLRCRDLESELAQSSWGGDLDLCLILTGIDLDSVRLSLEDHELDSEGTWLSAGGVLSMGVTQSDSLDHTRQLRFSNRGPSSSVSEHFENIDHIAIRLLAFEGSMWCILPRLRDKTGGAFKRAGILFEYRPSREREREER